MPVLCIFKRIILIIVTFLTEALSYNNIKPVCSKRLRCYCSLFGIYHEGFTLQLFTKCELKLLSWNFIAYFISADTLYPFIIVNRNLLCLKWIVHLTKSSEKISEGMDVAFFCTSQVQNISTCLWVHFEANANISECDCVSVWLSVRACGGDFLITVVSVYFYACIVVQRR